MLRTLEPEIRAKNKNAEADFKNPCSYKMKSVYLILCHFKYWSWLKHWSPKKKNVFPLFLFVAFLYV